MLLFGRVSRAVAASFGRSRNSESWLSTIGQATHYLPASTRRAVSGWGSCSIFSIQSHCTATHSSQPLHAV